MISAGLIGITIGLLPLLRINAFAKSWINILFLFILYGISAYSFDIYYYTQIYFTISALLIIYLVGEKINLDKILPKQIILLGQYSLLNYIIQIAYFRISFSLLSKYHFNKPNIMITVFSMTILTYITTLILNQVRPKYKYINKLYKIVFA
jgi:hypothetical protein